MPAYVFKGKTRAGAATSGERTADSKDAVIAMLRREQVLVTSVKEKGKEIALPKFGGGISSKDVAIFTRQFSVMIDAGLPLVQCLEILGTQQDNPGFQKVLLTVRQDVEGGSSLADAMKKHPKVFDDLFTNMIAAGEAGGILDTILKRLSTYIEKSVKLKSQDGLTARAQLRSTTGARDFGRDAVRASTSLCRSEPDEADHVESCAQRSPSHAARWPARYVAFAKPLR